MGRAKSILTIRMMVEVHYHANGFMTFSVCEPDKRKGNKAHKKWKRVSHGIDFHPPSWDELHNFSYPLTPDGDRTMLPAPLFSVMASLKCAASEAARRSERKEQP